MRRDAGDGSRGGPSERRARSKRRGRSDPRTQRSLARAGSGRPSGTGPGSFLTWSLLAIAAGVVLVAVVAFTSRQGSPASTEQLITPAVVTPSSIPSDGRTLGSPGAPVTIDLYGDFRCSACYHFTFGGTEQRMVDTYVATGEAKLAWHDFLTIDRPGETASRDAANAAWCAADQGRFWVMHDWLYANQSPTEDASAFTMARLSAIARAAGLDMARFQPCLDGGTHDAAIAAEEAGAPAAVGGTPSVFVNGAFVGSQTTVPTFAQIQAAVESALASAPPSSPAP